MAKFPISGANAQIAYGWETTFGTSGTVNKAFSQGVKVPTYDIDNDPEFIYAIGSQDIQRQIAKTFKGTWGVEFILSDPWWFRSILGGAPKDTAGTPNVHVWEASTQGLAISQTPMTILYGFNLETDSAQMMVGSIANNATLTCAVGDPIRVRLEGWFKNLTKNTTLPAQISPVEEPMTFAYGSLKFSTSGTLAVISDIQSVELTFNRNNEPIYGLGSRYPSNQLAKQREWSLRISSNYEQDSDFFNAVLGSTIAPVTNPLEVGGAELVISNGLTGASMRSFAITFGPCFVHRASIPSSPEEVVKIDLDVRARSISSVIVCNATAAAL